MKKLLIFLVLVVLIIASLPIIGNTLIESTLKDRLEVLTSYGLDVKEIKSESSYLKSTKEYEIFIEDTDKFILYLNQFSDAQIPPYVNAMINGTKIGAELKYSNFPLSDAVAVEIYPLELSAQVMADLKAEDSNLAQHVSKFLLNKGFLYHINYNIANAGFNGYLKNIDESFVVKSGYTAKLKMNGIVFDGEGELIAPSQLNSKIKEISFELEDAQQDVSMLLSDISVSSAFNSQTTYATLLKIGVLKFSVPDPTQGVNLSLEKITFDISSNTQGKKAQFFAKSSFDTLSLSSQRLNINAQNFNYDVALRDIDKDSFAKILELVNKAKINQTSQIQEDLVIASTQLLSRGLILDIADLSLVNLTLNNARNMGGFSLKSKLILQEDANLATKLQTNKASLVKNIEVNILFKMSKTMYDILSKNYTMLTMANGYAVEEKGNIIFDIKLKDEKFTINSKEIK